MINRIAHREPIMKTHLPLVIGAAAVLGAGCNNDAALVRQLQQEADTLRRDRAECMQQLADRDAQIAVLRRRIDQQPLLQNIELDDLFVVDRIELVSRTGGADFDGQPGDDGVVVYVRPLDRAGDVLKAAGQITVQLIDLTDPGRPRSLATYVYNDPDQLAELWYGGFLTDHYTLRCEFPPQVEPSRDVTVRVTFLEFLTGREFTASQQVTLDRIDPENQLVPRRAGR